jgi:hypothetical protein
MSARLLFAALPVVLLAGCGKPPEGTPDPTSRSEQKRALAGKESSTVGPITAEVLGWEVKKPALVGSKADGESLVLRVRFSTGDDTVKKDCLPPPTLLGPVDSCVDEFGNKYGIQNSYLAPADDPFPFGITKGTPITRTILIEKPIPKATRLEFDLSAKWVEIPDGAFRFTIPLK